MENYENLLQEAYEKVKPIKDAGRFEVPSIEGHQEGTRTIITNALKICAYIRRDCTHLIKFLSRELATPITAKGDVLVINRKVSRQTINEKIALYIKEFVTCRECGKPDTELHKEGQFMFVRCMACGAKHSVMAKIS